MVVAHMRDLQVRNTTTTDTQAEGSWAVSGQLVMSLWVALRIRLALSQSCTNAPQSFNIVTSLLTRHDVSGRVESRWFVNDMR